MKTFYLAFVFLFITSEVSARPEYALQLMTNRCTTCHTNPVGGGHRNLVGKAFGPKPATLESFSQQDVFGVDFRILLYTPVKKKEDEEKRASGMGVMAALPSVSVPFNKSNGREWRLLYSHNVGGFGGTSSRDAYLRVQLYEDYRLYPQYILLGRFSSPFGLLDDEHRTYVRKQTGTTWNHQEIGILFSGDFSHRFHYDLALVNGEQTSGTGFDSNQISLWGGVANLRALFSSWGWMLGASASYYNNDKNSSALSVYQNLSIGHLTQQLLPGNLTAEVVLARKMNLRIPPKFFTDLTYYNDPEKGISESNSLGYKVQWNYNFLPDWKFIFKYDHLVVDKDYMGDSYQRYGLGLRHFFNNQVSAQVRYEKAIAHPESEQATARTGFGLAKQDVIWALLQIKI